MTNEQREKLKAKYVEYKAYYPDAEFAPWDDPPVGRRVQKDRLTGIIVGIDDREFLPQPAHHMYCPSCTCKGNNPFFGWWHIKSDRYKDEDGTPHVMIEYPPGWKLVKEG